MTRTDEEPVKAVGYCRVSTEKQVHRRRSRGGTTDQLPGLSLEVQQEKIRAMAVVQGATLSEIIVDPGESAKTLVRPGMVRLLALVEQGAIQIVIVAKLDRLTRSVKDLADLLEHFRRADVRLVSVAESLDTGSAAGRLVLNIMTAVSQWEREAIGERTRDILQYKKANGERVGTTPYGFRVVPCQCGGLPAESRCVNCGLPLVARLEPDLDEQQTLGIMLAIRAQGAATRGIAKTLNNSGRRTRKGTLWRHQYVAALLEDHDLEGHVERPRPG